jgi:hypothetical protein
MELEKKLMTISSGEIIKRGKNGATWFQSLAMSLPICSPKNGSDGNKSGRKLCDK